MSFISQVDTWITKPEQSDDGWATIKPFLFLRLTTSDGLEGWGEAFTLPSREKGVNEIIHNLIPKCMVSRHYTPQTNLGLIPTQSTRFDSRPLLEF